MSKVTVNLNRLDDAYNFQAVNDSENIVLTDGSENIGGKNKGMRPMQMLLAAVGSCSAIDVIGILKKQRQGLEDISVRVEGNRDENEVPSLYRKVHIHYTLKGNLDDAKVARAIDLSVNQYCSVSKMIEKVAEISSSYEIVK
jgi:putative redox protein